MRKLHKFQHYFLCIYVKRTEIAKKPTKSSKIVDCFAKYAIICSANKVFAP